MNWSKFVLDDPHKLLLSTWMQIRKEEVAMHFIFRKNKRHVDGIDQETWLKDGSELESDGRRTNSQ